MSNQERNQIETNGQQFEGNELFTPANLLAFDSALNEQAQTRHDIDLLLARQLQEQENRKAA